MRCYDVRYHCNITKTCYHHETLKTDGQWLSAHALISEVAAPAIGREARFAVAGINCSNLNSTLRKSTTYLLHYYSADERYIDVRDIRYLWLYDVGVVVYWITPLETLPSPSPKITP